MAGTTAIEWSDKTWNPWVGCSIKTAGCAFCYAQFDAYRKMFNPLTPQYVGVARKTKNGAVFTGQVNRNSDRSFYAPLRWGVKRGQRTLVFVNSMSDFFHENVLPEWQAEAIAIMNGCPLLDFLILTKRPELIELHLDRIGKRLPPNVWLGTTVEGGRDIKDPATGKTVVDRIDMLRAVQHDGIKWISAEPLISDPGEWNLDGIHWVVAGGESLPSGCPKRADAKQVRRLDPAWIDSLLAQCRAQGVAFFMKQWGQLEFNPDPLDRTAKENGGESKGGCLIHGEVIREYPAPRSMAAAA
jgi:protein gp37